MSVLPVYTLQQGYTLSVEYSTEKKEKDEHIW